MASKRKPVARDVNSAIGKRLQRLRKERNISQVEMARLLGITQPNVSAYERGQFRLNAEVLIKLAETLTISIDELLGVGSAKPKPSMHDQRFLRYFAVIDDLPQRDRDALLRMLRNTVAARQASKRRS